MNTRTEETNEMIDATTSDSSNKDLVSLSFTSLSAHSIFQSRIDEPAYPALAKAVIEDNDDAVCQLTAKNPSLILFSPDRKLQVSCCLPRYARRIQTYLLDENALTLAVKCKNLNMFHRLLSMTRRISTEDFDATISFAFASWQNYPLKQDEQGQLVVTPPNEYVKQAKRLLDMIWENKKIKQVIREVIALRDSFNPNEAIPLNDLDNVELFVIALYQVFYDKYTEITSYSNDDQEIIINLNKLSAFCYHVLYPMKQLLRFRIDLSQLHNAQSEFHLGSQFFKRLAKNDQSFAASRERHTRDTQLLSDFKL